MPVVKRVLREPNTNQKLLGNHEDCYKAVAQKTKWADLRKQSTSVYEELAQCPSLTKSRCSLVGMRLRSRADIAYQDGPWEVAFDSPGNAGALPAP